MKIPFNNLKSADLHKGATYLSNNTANFSGEVLSKLMMVGNQSGFRKRKQKNNAKQAYVVLESTNTHPDWPDVVNEKQKLVSYYGDQNQNGLHILDTKQGGNAFLNTMFSQLLQNNRLDITPVFHFMSSSNRSRKFVGLLVPGNKHIDSDKQIEVVRVGKNSIINYLAHFTILDTQIINRNWLIDLINGNGYESNYAPEEWKEWIHG